MSDLLVHLALRELFEHVELTARKRTRLYVALAVSGVGKLVHQRPERLGGQLERASRLQQLLRLDTLAVTVVGEHVGKAHHRGLTLGVVGVVALDRAREAARQAPAPSEDAPDERVVDAQLAALAAHALLRSTGLAVDLGRVGGIGMEEDQLSDVVQQRRGEQLVALGVVDLTGQTVGGGLGGHRVQAEALGSDVPARRALEEVEGAGPTGQLLDARPCEQLDGLGDARHLAPPLGRVPVRHPQGGRDEGDVRLHRGDDVAGGGAVLAHQAHDPVARLGERRERLERLEGGGQAAAMALVGPSDVAARSCGCLGHCDFHWFRVASPVEVPSRDVSAAWTKG